MRRWKPRHHDIASSCSGWVEVRALAGPVHLGLPSLVDSGKGIRRCHHCEDCLKSRGSIIFSEWMIAQMSQVGDSDRSDGRVGRFWSLLQKIGCPKWKREGRSYIAIAGVDAYIISPRLRCRDRESPVEQHAMGQWQVSDRGIGCVSILVVHEVLWAFASMTILP